MFFCDGCYGGPRHDGGGARHDGGGAGHGGGDIVRSNLS